MRPATSGHSLGIGSGCVGRAIYGNTGWRRHSSGPHLPHSPSREDRAFTNEDVNPDIHGVYTNETENHPEDDSEQSVTQRFEVSVGEIVDDRHSVPYDTEHSQE